MSSRILDCLLMAGLALTAPVSTWAAELRVYPVRLELSASEPVATLTLHNAGQEATLLQMRVFAWSQNDGEDRLEATRNVLANPGLFELAPGADQIARLGLHMPAAAKEQSFRILIDEVPRQAPDKPGEIRTLLRVSVPLFIDAPNTTGRLDWTVRQGRNGKIDVDVRNDGAAHVQLTDLRLARTDRQIVGEQRLSVYVLPGASQHVTVNSTAPLRSRETLILSASTDQTGIQTRVTAEAGADEQATH